MLYAVNACVAILGCGDGGGGGGGFADVDVVLQALGSACNYAN